MSANDGGPAFPTVEHTYEHGEPTVNTWWGMTKRDEFARVTLGGCHASEGRGEMSWGSPEELAAYCFRMADAMLKERDRG